MHCVVFALVLLKEMATAADTLVLYCLRSSLFEGLTAATVNLPPPMHVLHSLLQLASSK